MYVMQMWKQLYHWRTFEMLLINCEINLVVTWSAHCVTCEADRAIIFAITDPKLFVLVVTLLTQDNATSTQCWCKCNATD